jgi:hypothetical protein
MQPKPFTQKQLVRRQRHLTLWLAKRGLRCCHEGTRKIAASRHKSWRAYHREHNSLWSYSGDFNSWWDRVTRNNYSFQNAHPRSKPLTLNSHWPFRNFK